MAAYALNEVWNGGPKQPRQLIEVLLSRSRERQLPCRGGLAGGRQGTLRAPDRGLPRSELLQGPFGPAEGKTPDHGLHGHGMSRSQCGPLVEWCSSQFRMEASDTSADRLFTVER